MVSSCFCSSCCRIGDKAPLPAASVEENGACFIVRDHGGQALGMTLRKHCSSDENYSRNNFHYRPIDYAMVLIWQAAILCFMPSIRG
jgi:hypothetical protein